MCSALLTHAQRDLRLRNRAKARQYEQHVQGKIISQAVCPYLYATVNPGAEGRLFYASCEFDRTYLHRWACSCSGTTTPGICFIDRVVDSFSCVRSSLAVDPREFAPGSVRFPDVDSARDSILPEGKWR